MRLPLARSWPLILVAAGYLLLRLPGLLALPLFNDEAVYLLRAQEFPAMLADWGPAGATLPDGKLIQELLLAALAGLPGDPLVPARLLSVACGLATIGLLCRAGRAAGSPAAGLIAALLYALAPLAQIHDRLALPDSMLTAASAGLLWASVDYGRRPQAGRREAALIGGILAVASLIKLSGLLLIVVPALAALLLAESRRAGWQRLLLLRTALIVALLPLACLAFFHYGGAERSKLGSQESRLAVTAANAAVSADWLARYLPAPLLLPALGALAAGARRRMIAFLLAAGLGFPLLLLLVGQTVYPRYFLPAWPALLLAAGLGSVALWQGAERRGLGRGLAAGAVGLGAAWSLWFALAFIREPAAAAMAAEDRGQYTERWTAGHNLPAIMAELRGLAGRSGGLTLIHHDQPRLLNMAPQIYLDDQPQIQQILIDLRADDAPARLRDLGAAGPTYLLVDEQVRLASRSSTRFPWLRLVRAYPNPAGTMTFYLYAVP